MRFFSKLAFITNLCFIATMIMQMIDVANIGYKKGAEANGVVHLNPVIATVVILGMLVAVFINLFFVVWFVARYPAKKMNGIPRWLVFFNMILLPAEIYYLFFT